jgi:hypothetical protein
VHDEVTEPEPGRRTPLFGTLVALGTLAVAGGLATWLLGEAPPVTLEGVVNAAGTPVHLLLTSSEGAIRLKPSTALVDSPGTFTFVVPKRDSERLRLVARAAGFETYTRAIGPGSQGPLDISLVPSRPIPGPPDYVEERELVGQSGQGSDFSPPYEICSPPARPGFVVKSTEFQLRGDRSCGAWATCEQKPSSSAQQACWTFRLQGHSECTPFFGACASVRQSIGILRITYTHVGESPPSGQLKTVYVQSDPTRDDAVVLCNSLRDVGYRCPPVELTAFSGPGEIVYFADQDGTAAQELSRIVEASVGPLLVRQHTQPAPASTSGLVRPGQFEIWLPAKQP